MKDTGISVLDMTEKEAKAFFLKPESYFSLSLPKYFDFKDLLLDIDKYLTEAREKPENWKEDFKKVIREFKNTEEVNYTLYNNKNGKYAWRPFKLIHPFLYVLLVQEITIKDNWEFIRKSFNTLSQNEKIVCKSIPRESRDKDSDSGKQISYWYEEIEQKSIELSIEFSYLFHTDITDCYGSIYTHSIDWALHSKEEAKKNKTDKNRIGAFIDNILQAMNYGQTNGIPQGSTLMDFIAEMVLHYIDETLSHKLSKAEEISDYKILRYRDDYRIFVNNPQVGEKILKLLTESMIELGLKLNSEKTSFRENVIQASIKTDKLDWILKERGKSSRNDLQKNLLIIHDHGLRFPGSGFLKRLLAEYCKPFFSEKIKEKKRIEFKEGIKKKPVLVASLIRIVVDIAYHNPICYQNCASILSYLIDLVETIEEKRNLSRQIKTKFDQLPNTGYLHIWIQHITRPFDSEMKYEEPLCILVSEMDKKSSPIQSIWKNIALDASFNNVFNKALKAVDDITKIINKNELENAKSTFEPDKLFHYES